MQTTPTRRMRDVEVRDYRISEVLFALSHALDLTEGQPPGHTLRSTAIGMRFADELALDEDGRADLYCALLLKDAGCSANSAAVSEQFGADDAVVKRELKTTNWTNALSAAGYAWRNAGRGRPVLQRMRHFSRIAIGGHDMAREMVRVRCDRGAEIAARLGFNKAVARAVRCLDEHWDGKGHAEGIRGDEIPLASRIANLAQTIEVFFTAKGAASALDVVGARSKSWFDPSLVRICQTWRQDHSWWRSLLDGDLENRVLAMEPAAHARHVDDDGLDRVAEAFAAIVDAKSPYTSRHSVNVAKYATGIAGQMRMDGRTIRSLYRAGLLHDIGKLGVSNTILDKAAPLTAEEREAMAQHPRLTWSILRRVNAFRDFAWTAALHHERLDGSGYPWALRADDLDPEARILAVADVWEALTARRPYRDGLPVEQALMIIRKDTPFRYDGTVLGALESWLDR
jgi:HD-GYP domain-containing protein (c-di-GMP phosphodiesterase class II)